MSIILRGEPKENLSKDIKHIYCICTVSVFSHPRKDKCHMLSTLHHVSTKTILAEHFCMFFIVQI
jgi:hypothetical protein